MGPRGQAPLEEGSRQPSRLPQALLARCRVQEGHGLREGRSVSQRALVEHGYLTGTGSSLGEVVRWARAVGAPLDEVALEPYHLGRGVQGVVAVWYGWVETVEVPPELL